jgi:enterochelin esterase-like enzyme
MRNLIALVFALLIVASTSAGFTDSDLLAEAENLPVGQSRILIDGDNITFLYRAIITDLDAVVADYGMTGEMRLIDTTTNLWASTHNIPNLDEAILSYRFTELKNRRVVLRSEFEFWRGENAPPVPPQSHPLRGFVREFRFESLAMDETRFLTIYFPPDYDISQTYPVIYSTSGQNIAGYLPYLDQLIVSGEIPPVLLIAAHYVNHMDEYIPAYYFERFEQHREFFVQELRLWAETNLGASSLREERAVFGGGTGGVFATVVAVLHSDIYGIAFPFYIAMDESYQYQQKDIDPTQRLYFTSGTIAYEHTRVTHAVYERFSEAGAQVIYHERIAGSDVNVWQEEFYHAVLWAFGE